MDLGIRLGIEGERDFKNALRDINQSFKVLGSEMQLVSSQFDKNDKSTAALAARKGVLSKEIEAQRGKVDTLQAALDNASESFGENDKRTQNWQIALNKATADLNHMERELDNTETALEGVDDEMSSAVKNTDKLGDELEDTGETADDASGKFDKLGDVVKGVGVAIGAAMAAIGAASVAAGKALYDMAMDTANAGVEASNTAQKMGLSRQGVQEWDYILSQNGATMYHFTYGMRNLQNAMGGLDEDGGKIGKTIERLGLNFEEIKQKSPEDAMNDLVTAFQGMEESTEKTNMVLTIFGRRAGMELMPMLNSSAEATDELRQRAHELGMVMGDESIDAAMGFSNSMDTLKRSFAGAKNAIGAQLLPGFTQISDGLVGLISGCEDAGEQILEGVEQTVAGIADAIPRVLDLFNTVATTVAEIAPDIISSLVTGIVDNLPLLLESALAVIMALLEGIIGALPKLFEGAVQVIVTLVEGIADSLPQLIPAIVEAVVTMVQALIDNLPMILDAALQLITGLAVGLLDALPVLIAALPDIIIGIVEFLIGAIPQIIDAGIALLVSLVEALPEIITAIVEAIPQIIDGIITAVLGSIPQLIDAGIRLLVSLVENLPTIIVTIVGAIPQIITSVVNALVGAIPQIIRAGVELLISLVQNLPQIISTVVRAVPEIVRGMIDAFMGFVSSFADIGLNLIRGLWDGIRNAGAWLRDQITGFVSNALGGLARFLGINSPSKYMADLFGKNMALGLGEGFSDEMENVCKTMQEAIPTSLDGPDIDLDGNINTALGGAGTAVSLGDIGYKLDGIAGLMAEMFPQILDAMNIKVVLDDGTLVGRLAPEIDRSLAMLRKRGLAGVM